MLLIYTHTITPRVKYIFKQICTRILGVPVAFTTTIEDFIAHDSLKISYTNKPLGNEFFVKSHSLLFEKNISDIPVKIKGWEDTKCFFLTDKNSHLPFDIFAASFYLISRYEEYFPSIKDSYGRFDAKNSLAFKHQFLQTPVVDIWALKFKEKLATHFKTYQFIKKTYNVKPIVLVSQAYAYAQKGAVRTLGGVAKDLFRFNLKFIYLRILVLLNLKKDPYDTFNWIINRQKQSKFSFYVFFSVGGYSTYNKNTSINKKNFVTLIKSINDYCKVGLKISYFALSNFQFLKQEKSKIDEVINTQVNATINSFTKLNLPQTYRNLIDLEVTNDYTMGYAKNMGFRAGTCTPFLFYDLDYDIQTPLLIHPFQLIDTHLLSHKSLLDKNEAVQKIIQQVKRVDGTFTAIFNSNTLNDFKQNHNFKKIFNQVVASVN